MKVFNLKPLTIINAISRINFIPKKKNKNAGVADYELEKSHCQFNPDNTPDGRDIAASI